MHRQCDAHVFRSCIHFPITLIHGCPAKHLCIVVVVVIVIVAYIYFFCVCCGVISLALVQVRWDYLAATERSYFPYHAENLEQNEDVRSAALYSLIVSS